jgi:diguanylate cyclase (GGDEF)-like protein
MTSAAMQPSRPISKTRPQILVADDSAVFRDMLQKMLSAWDYDVTVVSDGREAWEQLQHPGGPRLALLDWMMPGIEGAEICRKVRDSVHDRYVYIILISVRADLKDLVEGMESGADDYVVKPFQMEELRARLRAGQRVLALQDQLVEAREALREQATRDALTGLWNRRAIHEILQNEIARSGRSGQPLMVLMADLDGFKPVNDRFGHLVGDAVLRQAAGRMRASVRRYDAVGRYGGEEFLIVLPGCEVSGGLVLAERIREAIGAEVFRVGEIDIRITCSLGGACYLAHFIRPADNLVRDADAALYRAKHKGGNRVEPPLPDNSKSTFAGG